MQSRRYQHRFWAHALSAPIIYGCAIFILLFDLVIEIYHRTCFKLYGLPYVKRSNYIRFDRRELKYLNLHEKINCTYCSYANGLMAYISRIFGDTEKYWCGIKHKEMEGFHKFHHHEDFATYGDAKSLDEKFGKRK